MNNFWTDEHVEQLKEYWAEGLSCSQISRAFGGAVSRNSVIGKVSRLNLAGRATTMRMTRTKRVEAKATRPKLALVAEPPPVPADFLCAPETFAEGQTCRFIHGDTGSAGWVMCGRPGHPWCSGHAAIVFDKTRTAAANKASSERAETRNMRRVG